MDCLYIDVYTDYFLYMVCSRARCRRKGVKKIERESFVWLYYCFTCVMILLIFVSMYFPLFCSFSHILETSVFFRFLHFFSLSTVRMLRTEVVCMCVCVHESSYIHAFWRYFVNVYNLYYDSRNFICRFLQNVSIIWQPHRNNMMNYTLFGCFGHSNSRGICEFGS